MPNTTQTVRGDDTNSSLTLEIADFLLSPQANISLAALQSQMLSPAYSLQILTELRKEFTPNQAAALLRLAQLRQKAARKFPQASRMFFTAESLEQSTAWEVALHRARQLHEAAPPGSILELGCGIGGDTVALAQFRHVVAYERDPLRLRFAQANAGVLGVADRIDFRCADWTAALNGNQLPSTPVAYVDPARRSEGKRIFSLHQTEPPLATLLELQTKIPLLAVKTMPGIQDDELPTGCSIEFVSHEGTCKEAVLWMGSWRWEGDEPRRWASVCANDGWAVLESSGHSAPIGPLQVGQYLCEPDPAVIRAGALAELCERLDAHLFDAQIAYLVGEIQHPPSTFYDRFQIDEVHPFSLRLLNLRLQALCIGQVELKKRGFPEEPEQLRSRLKLVPGGRNAVIFFTRRGEERLMFVARRIA